MVLGKKKAAGGYLLLAFTVLIAAGFLIWPKETAAAVRNGIFRCTDTVIPSLMGFMALSGFLVESGLYLKIGSIFSWPARHIFRMEPGVFAVFFISQLAGYPVGCRLLSALYRENSISKKQCEQLLGLCYNAGPAFLIGLVGVGVFGSPAPGAVIYLALVITNLLMAIVFGAHLPVPPKNPRKDHDFPPPSLALVEAVKGAGSALLTICWMIIAFSLGLTLANESGILEGLATVLGRIMPAFKGEIIPYISSILEITAISTLKNPGLEAMPIIGAIFAFGGVCVLLQVMAIGEKGLLYGHLWLTRLIASGAAFAATALLTNIWLKIDTSASAIFTGLPLNPASGFTSLSPITQSSPLPSLCLMAMTLLLLKETKKEG